jgi:hypothetical protein
VFQTLGLFQGIKNIVKSQSQMTPEQKMRLSRAREAVRRYGFKWEVFEWLALVLYLFAEAEDARKVVVKS